MVDDHTPSTEDAPLESWKAIAAYLSRDVRTVMRWEKSEGLPIHRHRHLARSSVYAYRGELDRWRAGRRVESLERSGSETSTGFRVVLVAVAAALSIVSAGGGGSTSLADGPTDRLVSWPGNPSFALDESIAPDGRYVTYVDHDTSELAIRDLRTGQSRTLTTLARKGGFIASSATSRDGRLVAFAATDDQKDETRNGLFLSSLAPGEAPPRRLLANAVIDSIDWSPDDNRLLIVVERGPAADIALVSVVDGALRVLKTIDRPGPGHRVVWSPDGRGIAYDVQAQPSRRQRAAYWLPADGGPALRLIDEQSSDSVVGWSPDGHSLVLRSDREGSRGLGLWALPVKNGRAAGAPLLVVPAFTGTVVGLTESGALFYEHGLTKNDLLVASIDPRTGARVGPVTFGAHDREAVNVRPRWSADGRSFAYVTARATGPVLSIRTLSTGVVKEVPLNLSYLWTFDWSPNGQSIVCRARDLEGRGGLFLVNLATGETRRFNGLGLYFPQFTPDGKSVGYLDLRREDAGLPAWQSYVEWTISSGATRVIQNLKDFIASREPLGRSPDGKIFLAMGTSAGATTLIAYDMRTRQSRAVLHVDRPDAVNVEDGLEWLPDSSGVVVNVRGAAPNAREVWWVPVETTGGARALDVGVPNVIDSAIAVRLDAGRLQIAFVAGDPLPSRTTTLRYEFRMLENFLPSGSDLPGHAR